jgi:hypothetical protein
MIELLEDMPEGTVGFRAAGKVSADDYRQVLEPALKAATDSGEVRMLYVLESDFDMTPGATLQDARTGIAAYSHHSTWKRTAIVTDTAWVVKSLHAFEWMFPGELAVFPLTDVDAAKHWVADPA